MIKIAIVEDEAMYAKQLRNFYINMKKKMGRLLISRSIRMGIRSSINISHSMTSF